jgi:NAD(P)-dependent dehydrogenase (short-subunit alcohol dehydrogenase family)
MRRGDLDGRVFVVTGASSGLGARFVHVLIDNGAYVVATARRVGRLDALVARFGTQRLRAVPGDITRPDFPAAVMTEAGRAFGRLDGLVNNAGVTSPCRAEEESTDLFTRVIGTNLVAPFVCCREAFPLLRQSDGASIVNVASSLGIIGTGRIPQASYCASKGGLINMSRELAAQWAQYGIRVNCLAPGWFPTEMTEDMMGDERSLRYIERTVPMRRPGAIGELDGALLLLLGPTSTYITGQVIVVDGGWTAV